MEKAAEFFKNLDCNAQVVQLVNRTKRNFLISGYFNALSDEYSEDCESERYFFDNDGVCKRKIPSRRFLCKNDYQKKAIDIAMCGRNWFCDVFPLLKIKDLKKTFTCKNIFCENCQAKLGQQRYAKYAPELNNLSVDNDVYHIVFTVPNVSADRLKSCVDKMYYEFAYINRLFTGNAKIHGVDFLKYGYVGAVRSLEITRNVEDKTFHPHFHCYFLFRKGQGICYPKWQKNDYSYDQLHVKKSHKKGKSKRLRLFSDFEILLQKVWRLRFDGVKVTKKNIDELSLGYSVICDLVKPGDYKEVFKYAIKGAFVDNEGMVTLSVEEFKKLYETLKNRKIIQGYQGLRHFVFDDNVDLSSDDEYLIFRDKIEVLDPTFIKNCREELGKIVDNIEYNVCKYISRRSVREYMQGDNNETSNENDK